MPHIIIEHSADIKSSQITNLHLEIQGIMAKITEGNFDPDQCKCRSHSFDEYFVGKFSQEHSSFIHVTIKILSGRKREVQKQLSENVILAAKNLFAEIFSKPSEKDQIIAVGNAVVDAITGIPHIDNPPHNSSFEGKRCDISVDIIDMERETYQKIRIENL